MQEISLHESSNGLQENSGPSTAAYTLSIPSKKQPEFNAAD